MASESTTTTATVRMVVTTAASVATTMVLVRTLANDLLPHHFQDFLAESVSHLFSRFSTTTTIIIDEYRGYATNHMFKAVEGYLGSNLPVSSRRLKVNKEDENDRNMEVTMERGEEIVDVYRGNISCKWQLVCHETRRNVSRNPWDRHSVEVRHYQLSFHRSHREEVLQGYLPHVMEQWRSIKERKKGLRIHAARYGDLSYDGMDVWTDVNLDHPATFKTLAMEPQMKEAVVEDLERFVRRKEYYRKVGKAWKRGYLLYGPPGTGKSSLIAAMANHLKFDIYDLDLSQVTSNSDLKRLLMATKNKSMLVVEDIDCSIDLENREEEAKKKKESEVDGEDDGNGHRRRKQVKMTLSGLLNLVDGLWSSCGDERIIVFTTNHKDRLDPAVLRPGRMDLHIHMSYCTPSAFRVLASNYHSIDDHHLFGEIDRLIAEVEVTPAELAEELLRCEEADEALKGVIALVEEKKRSNEEHVTENSSPVP